MIQVKRVETKKEQKDFLDFPLKLYQDNPYFVPPLYGDEKKIFSSKCIYADICDSVFYNAYEDGTMVGRIQGIIQLASNEKNKEKRIRFNRFDAIDDPEVSKRLFEAVEEYGLSKGMDTICGPLGYSDLEREGLLIEGFDKLSTFEEQYNYEYYMHHIEAMGFEKEVDWIESEIRVPKENDGTLHKMSEYIMKRYDLHWSTAKTVPEFLEKYADKFFDLLDRSYDKLYGTVPFTDGMKKMMIDNFRLIIKLKYVAAILDKDENLVCLGVCFPSLSRAVQKSGGHLTPLTLARVLHDINHPTVIDFGLMGVDPAYLNRGVSACVADQLIRMLSEPGIDHAETNLNLEDNHAIRNLWKRFDSIEHKKRRCYVKKL